ncbi:MAG: tRNA pseudouridine(55) synthase TruB [Clostridia bacterium]|nr:tRNA pseudouridine(55) synthase TruB [Clostridia bacterium]
MDGFVNMLKPPGMTSSDAALFVRKRLPRGVKTGHCGTLDPDAAGVLAMSVGKATRLFDYVIDREKEYIATVTFGIATDTQDATGRSISKSGRIVSADEVKEIIPSFVGDIMQTPPMYSAIKRGGKRLYEMARAGVEADVEPRKVRVESIDLLDQLDANRFMIRVVCHKGVYIRTLAHDMGQALGCGAHMSFLLRTRVGVFEIGGASTLEELSRGDMAEHLLAMDEPVKYLPEIRLNENLEKAVLSGNRFFAPDNENKTGLFRVYMGKRFAGICDRNEAGVCSFERMLLRGGT